MLYDKGLLTDCEIKEFREYEARLSKDIMSGVSVGCRSSSICVSCNHLISDSICLCNGYFICPNCKYENGNKFPLGKITSNSINFNASLQSDNAKLYVF